MHIAKWKKSAWNVYIIYDSNHNILENAKLRGDNKKISNCQESFERKDQQVKLWHMIFKTFRAVETIGIPCFVALHFTVLCGYWDLLLFFYILKVCGDSASSKSVGVIFSTAVAHFMSLCHILVGLRISLTFPLSLYLL